MSEETVSAQVDGLTELCMRGRQCGVGLRLKNSDFCFHLANLASYTGNIYAVGEIKKQKIKTRLEALFFFLSPQERENKRNPSTTVAR